MRRHLIAFIVAVLLIWGLVSPPQPARRDPFSRDEEDWNEGRLQFELQDLVDGSLVTGARVLLSTPGGRQLEARSDPRGRVEFPLFLLDDFLFRLVVESPAHERFDHRLRGADLARRRHRRILLLPESARVSLGGRLSCREAALAPPRLLCRWWLPGEGLRPAGRETEVRLRDEDWNFLIRDLPPGACFELQAAAEVEIPGARGLAAAGRRGRVETEDLDLGDLELRARTVVGWVRDREGKAAPFVPLALRLSGQAGATLETVADAFGRYAFLVPFENERLNGRVALGEGEGRLVELPWEARGGRAVPLVWPVDSVGLQIGATPRSEAPLRQGLSVRRGERSPGR